MVQKGDSGRSQPTFSGRLRGDSGEPVPLPPGPLKDNDPPPAPPPTPPWCGGGEEKAPGSRLRDPASLASDLLFAARTVLSVEGMMVLRRESNNELQSITPHIMTPQTLSKTAFTPQSWALGYGSTTGPCRLTVSEPYILQKLHQTIDLGGGERITEGYSGDNHLTRSTDAKSDGKRAMVPSISVLQTCPCDHL